MEGSEVSETEVLLMSLLKKKVIISWLTTTHEQKITNVNRTRKLFHPGSTITIFRMEVELSQLINIILFGSNDFDESSFPKKPKLSNSTVYYVKCCDPYIVSSQLIDSISGLFRYIYDGNFNPLIVPDSSKSILILWPSFNSERYRVDFEFRDFVTAVKKDFVIVLFNRFLGHTSRMCYLVKKMPSEIDCYSISPIAAGQKHLKQLEIYEQETFKQVLLIERSTSFQGQQDSMSCEKEEYGDVDKIRSDNPIIGLDCDSENSQLHKDFQISEKKDYNGVATDSEIVNFDATIEKQASVNSSCITIKNPPVCSYHNEEIIQDLEPGVDLQSSFKDRFHIVGSTLKWVIVIPHSFFELLSKLLEYMSLGKSLALFLLGPTGSGKSHNLYICTLFFRCQKQLNVRVVYIPDCLMWKSAKSPLKFLLDEIIFSLSLDDMGFEIQYSAKNIDEHGDLQVLLSELSTWAALKNLNLLFIFDRIKELDIVLKSPPFDFIYKIPSYDRLSVLCCSSDNNSSVRRHLISFESQFFKVWLSLDERKQIAIENSPLDDVPQGFESLITGLEINDFCKVVDPKEPKIALQRVQERHLYRMLCEHRCFCWSILDHQKAAFLDSLNGMLSFQMFPLNILPTTFDHKGMQLVSMPHLADVPEALLSKLLSMTAFEAEMEVKNHGLRTSCCLFFPVRKEYLKIMIDHNQISTDTQRFFKSCIDTLQNVRFNSVISGFIYEKFFIEYAMVFQRFSLHVYRDGKIYGKERLFFVDIAIDTTYFRGKTPTRVIDNLRNPGLMFIPMEYNNKGYDFYIFDRIRRIFYAVQVTCTKDYAGHFQSSFLSMKKDLKSNWISYLKNYPSPSMLHFPCVIVLITRASQKIQSA